MLKWSVLAVGLGLTLVGCSARAGDEPSPPPSTPTPVATPSVSESPSPAASESASPSPSASPSEEPSATGSPSSQAYHGLVPFPDVKAPEITEVVPLKMTTDAGEMLLEVYPQAAPNSAKRFLGLVKAGFYNDTPLFRVEPGFVVQFGINWRKPFQKEQETNFKEDPSLFALERGTLCFAKTNMPDSASTQVFINYADNSGGLRPLNFTVFGRVTKGMEVSEEFRSPGPVRQDLLWQDGGNYLKTLQVQPHKILKLEVVKPPEKK